MMSYPDVSYFVRPFPKTVLYIGGLQDVYQAVIRDVSLFVCKPPFLKFMIGT